jgi:RNA polymerase sigma-70 factor (ECF subfamily)
VVVAEIEHLPVRQARAGDPAAWDALFRRYQLPLYTYAFELLHEQQASLDVVQETFINASRHIGSLREDGKFGSWMFGIAHQKCIQRWRKQNREETALAEFAAAQPGTGIGEDALDLLIREEDDAEFLRCIETLPLPQRSALLLHFLEGFSLEEIATATGVPLGTVKSRLFHAKRALREILEKQRT